MGGAGGPQGQDATSKEPRNRKFLLLECASAAGARRLRDKSSFGGAAADPVTNKQY
jgi:hypothetical protein